MEFAKRLKRRHLIGLSCGVLVIGIAVILVRGPSGEAIDSYQACSAAGYPVQQLNPPVCVAQGKSFVGPVAAPTATTALANQPFELLVDANSEGNYPQSWQVISSQDAWEHFWRNVHAAVSLPPLIPVDFAAYDVIALSDGPKPSGSYRVEVSNIATSPNGTTVSITAITPVGCKVTPAPTNPYYLVQTAKLPVPVRFAVTNTDHYCTP